MLLVGIVPSNVGAIDGVMILGCVTGRDVPSNVRVIDGMMILGCVTGRDSTI